MFFEQNVNIKLKIKIGVLFAIHFNNVLITIDKLSPEALKATFATNRLIMTPVRQRCCLSMDSKNGNFKRVRHNFVKIILELNVRR